MRVPDPRERAEVIRNRGSRKQCAFGLMGTRGLRVCTKEWCMLQGKHANFMMSEGRILADEVRDFLGGCFLVVVRGLSGGSSSRHWALASRGEGKARAVEAAFFVTTGN